MIALIHRQEPRHPIPTRNTQLTMTWSMLRPMLPRLHHHHSSPSPTPLSLLPHNHLHQPLGMAVCRVLQRLNQRLPLRPNHPPHSAPSPTSLPRQLRARLPPRHHRPPWSVWLPSSHHTISPHLTMRNQRGRKVVCRVLQHRPLPPNHPCHQPPHLRSDGSPECRHNRSRQQRHL